MDTNNALVHPVRLRIVLALAGRNLTVAALREALPDVPQASLYRHVKLLERAGLLRVVEEHRVAGTIERTFALDREATAASEHELEKLDRAGLERLFGAFAASLMADFRRYLDSAPTDLRKDGVALRSFPMNLNDAELKAFAKDLRELLERYGERPRKGRRRRRTFSFVMIPETAPAKEEAI